MIPIVWRRENRMWIADVQEGRYQIEGRSGAYQVWYYGDDPYVRQPNTLVAAEQYYLDHAKQSAEDDYVKRMSPETLVADAAALLVKAQGKLALARDASDGEAQKALRSAHDALYAISKVAMLASKRVHA